ncbi:MAG: hypothetical protein V8T62_00720 [Oscillospiraceae bacterium]
MKRCKNCYYRRELFGFPDFPACHFAIEEGDCEIVSRMAALNFGPNGKGGTKSAAERAAEAICQK